MSNRKRDASCFINGYATAVEPLRTVVAVYNGSDGDATKALYEKLTAFGPIGIVATNLFRAQKNSARAKVYRGGERGRGSFRGMAYDRKNWAMDNLARTLTEHAGALNIVWGWGHDPDQPKHNSILYVELSSGQVSFHSEGRGVGPDYPGEWDGARGLSPIRTCQFVAGVLTAQGEKP